MLQTLNKKYGINISSIEQVEGGWSALAYKVETDKEIYFLKAYEKSRASTLNLIKRTPIYGEIICWLDINTELKGQILVPIKTLNGEFYCENDEFYFVLHPYINGHNMWNVEMTNKQLQQLTNIVAVLHKYDEEISDFSFKIKETFEISWLSSFEKTLISINNLNNDLATLLKQHSSFISDNIKVLKQIQREVKLLNLPLRLCHTDIHGMNIMADCDEKLILIDFETILFAPVEMDLMFFNSQKYWNKFYKMYKAIYPNFELNHRLLEYYRLKRVLEDCWEWIEQLLYDAQTPAQREETIISLKEEIEQLQRITQ